MTDRRRLSAQQERDLVIATGAGDLDACRRLVEAFLPAITALARRYPSGIGVQRQELLQEGVAGLLFATQRFDPGRNTPFWAYASFWVRKGMQELVAELTRPVALSDRAARGLAAIRTARSRHLQNHSAEPTSEELRLATGFSREQLETLQAVTRAPRSLQELLSDGADGSDSVDTIGNRIADGRAELAYEAVLDEIEIREVRDLADRLDERERAVICGHYGLGGPAQTLQQIGGTLGLTAERARQIEAGALDKLRQALARPASAGEVEMVVPRPLSAQRPASPDPDRRGSCQVAPVVRGSDREADRRASDGPRPPRARARQG
jgi:RNA polymerase sigma factor (sigma-70 family)